MAAAQTFPPRFHAEVEPADLAGDLIGQGHPLFGIVWVNPERLGGTPCFFGTRVPVKTLFDYLGSGHTVEGFLADFDDIDREHVTALLEQAQLGLLDRLPKP